MKPENIAINNSGKALFAFGITEDVAESKTDANKLPTQSQDADPDKISGQLHLFQMSSSITLEPTSEYFRRFHKGEQTLMQQYFKNIKKTLIKKLRYHNTRALKADTPKSLKTNP